MSYINEERTINPAYLTSNNLDWSTTPMDIDKEVRSPQNMTGQEESILPIYIQGCRVLRSWEIIRESDFIYEIYKNQNPICLERIPFTNTKEKYYYLLLDNKDSTLMPMYTIKGNDVKGSDPLFKHEWDLLIKEWDKINENGFMFNPEGKIKAKKLYIDYIESQKQLRGIKEGPIPPKLVPSVDEPKIL